VIRPVGDSDFLHVIMPMHLGNWSFSDKTARYTLVV
jgi:hypothetical protein